MGVGANSGLGTGLKTARVPFYRLAGCYETSHCQNWTQRPKRREKSGKHCQNTNKMESYASIPDFSFLFLLISEYLVKTIFLFFLLFVNALFSFFLFFLGINFIFPVEINSQRRWTGASIISGLYLWLSFPKDINLVLSIRFHFLSILSSKRFELRSIPILCGKYYRSCSSF